METTDLRIQLAGATIEKHKHWLATVPGVSAAAVGFKEIQGQSTREIALLVFVGQKTASPRSEHRVPLEFDGVRTDVIEQSFCFADVGTDPHHFSARMFSGLAITAEEDPAVCGTLGCFVRTTGKVHPPIPRGVYLLTNYHVVMVADPARGGNGTVIQPDTSNKAAAAGFSCGTFAGGYKDASHDCAIVQLDQGRSWVNEVPNRPGWPGHRRLVVNRLPRVHETVYKFGASTLYTTGRVCFLHYNSMDGAVSNAIYIRNDNQEPWVDGGDSGSVAVGRDDDHVVGLNFKADTNCKAPRHPGYYAGLAYPIQDQMGMFCDRGGSCTLA
ncbi:hypothetical protein [Methylococcus sp. EFPC2]|uniref:hypothetical protein n=1 Tax=Methylococcus sp. EFPC2 TaxID=2812648 RepID=UPI0019675D87|nr:hypothetical protein [Methylococcus sp. EFPC2]QSA97706.1 hypothetical protein JWZ97_02385 [Methylococcus sp. EFPC2]